MAVSFRSRLAAVAVALWLAPQVLWAAEPLKIAFVDTGNTGRSLMAETLAPSLATGLPRPVVFISRGLDVDPFDEAPEANARQLMTDRGFDVAQHRAQQLSARDLAHADLVLTMTPGHAEKIRAQFPDAKVLIVPLALYATGVAEPIPDAWGKPMETYRSVLAQLDRFLPLAIARAAKEITPRD
jgi:protein-tyrosine phosphatase